MISTRSSSKKHASEREAMNVGRIAGVAVMAVGVALVGIYISAESIYVALQEKSAYFVGPVAASFIGGIISRRAILSGAIAALALGMPAAWLLDVIPLTHSINFLHRVGMATAVAAFDYTAASWLTKPPLESSFSRQLSDGRETNRKKKPGSHGIATTTSSRSFLSS